MQLTQLGQLMQEATNAANTRGHTHVPRRPSLSGAKVWWQRGWASGLGINCNCRGLRKLAEVGLVEFFAAQYFVFHFKFSLLFLVFPELL